LNPLISIIIPYFNKKGTILRSINSILRQTYANWELIVIDDCGDEIIRVNEIPQDKRITILFNETNKGVAHTRQRGLEKSKGEYIAFLDADDWWSSNFLEICIHKLISCETCDGVYTQTLQINKDGTRELRKNCDLGLTKIREVLIEYKKPWQTGSVLWRVQSCGNWGQLKNYEDYWFDFTSINFNQLQYIPQIGLYHDLTGDNHLSEQNNQDEVAIGLIRLWLMVYSFHWNKVNIRYKLIILNRLFKARKNTTDEYYNIHSINLLSDNNIGFLSILISNAFISNGMHKILQKIGFKIKY
jgi:glycosyltransferase involved in cell wall biosynthesis